MNNIKSLDEFNKINEAQSIHNDYLAKVASSKSHTELWNSLVKWYDKAIRHADSNEVATMLRAAADEIEAANFDVIK